MGMWAVGLYDSDTAADVKDDFALWARIPGSVDDLIKAIVAQNPCALDEDDEDYPDIWLALADQLHVHGMAHKETFTRARHIITSGLDLATKTELGLQPNDAKKRIAVLDEVLQRWTRPHPKPKKRKLLKEPEPQAFPAGTVIVYPTCQGQARNYADPKNLLGWAHDGWGSAIILATGHERGWFGWTAAGRLSVHGENKPTLAKCLAASIETQPCYSRESGAGTIAIQVASLSPLAAKRMMFEAVGEVQLDPGSVAALHPDITAPKHVPAPTMYQVWTWWNSRVWPKLEMRDTTLASPGPAIALTTILAR